VFELLTASFASEDFDLKADWEKIKQAFKVTKVLNNTSNTDIIQAITFIQPILKRTEETAKGNMIILLR